MLSQIMKLASTAKSVSDIVSGKADADDYENAVETASDLLGTFVPAAAPILEVAQKYAPQIIQAVTSANPEKGAELQAAFDNLQETMNNIDANLAQMDEQELFEFMDNAGY